nr:hypothetical protein [Paenibacillus sp. 7541]
MFERFKRDCCEPVHRGYTIARFRLEFFHIAAKLIQHSRSVILKLAKDFAGRYAWKRIECRVAQLESAGLRILSSANSVQSTFHSE